MSDADVSTPASQGKAPLVFVESIERSGTGNRPVRSKRPVVESLAEHREEVQAAIIACSEILRAASANEPAETGDSLRITELSATFGLTFSTEGSVIVSKASIEASLEVTIKLERR